MGTRKLSFLRRVIAQLSKGSVPVDGAYWLDSHARHDADASESQSAHGRIPALASQPFSRQRCAS
jgi:hypothetical protein